MYKNLRRGLLVGLLVIGVLSIVIISIFSEEQKFATKQYSSLIPEETGFATQLYCGALDEFGNCGMIMDGIGGGVCSGSCSTVGSKCCKQLSSSAKQYLCTNIGGGKKEWRFNLNCDSKLCNGVGNGGQCS
ncbi:hypothetical protein J4462_00985 [Candidatus Pacearchaeota archaeon]|nr:hypothetical protein [Candidatus Pacearchaeota archaeon]